MQARCGHLRLDGVLDKIYQMPPPAQAWTSLEWIPKQRRKPSAADGVQIASTGKVMVWVLTVEAHRTGADPEVCGFHLDSRAFDDDCEGGGDEVLMWARLILPTRIRKNAA